MIFRKNRLLLPRSWNQILIDRFKKENFISNKQTSFDFQFLLESKGRGGETWRRRHRANIVSRRKRKEEGENTLVASSPKESWKKKGSSSADNTRLSLQPVNGRVFPRMDPMGGCHGTQRSRFELCFIPRSTLENCQQACNDPRTKDAPTNRLIPISEISANLGYHFGFADFFS